MVDVTGASVGATGPPRAAPPLFDPDQRVTVTAAALWIDAAWAEIGEVGPLTHHRPVPLPWWKSVRLNPVVVGGLGGLAFLVVGAVVAALLLGGGSSDPTAVAVPRTRSGVTAVTSTVPRPTAPPVASQSVAPTVAPTPTTVRRATNPTPAPGPRPGPVPPPVTDPPPEPPPVTDPPPDTTTTSTTTTTTTPTTTTTVPEPPPET